MAIKYTNDLLREELIKQLKLFNGKWVTTNRLKRRIELENYYKIYITLKELNEEGLIEMDKKEIVTYWRFKDGKSKK